MARVDKDAAHPMTYDEARRYLSRCDSYEVLPTFLEEFSGMRGQTPLRLLGDIWPLCDNISAYRQHLLALLPTFGPVRVMMTKKEQATWDALPDVVTVYRGCDRGVNEDGLSWSLDRDVAAGFPLLLRYRAKDPVLVRGTVRRSGILAVKLDREEVEVIVRGVKADGKPMQWFEWIGGGVDVIEVTSLVATESDGR